MDNLMGRYRNVSILAAAIFLQILGLAIQVKRSTENQSSRLIRVWAVSAITPLEKAIVRAQMGTSDIWHNYVYLRGVREQNRELRDQIQQLQLERVRLEQDANQAHRLQALLGFKEQFIAKTVAAQVIGSSGSEQSRTVYIDKGSRDGIQPDMAVISAAGIVGKVATVYKSTSEVLLINDQQSGVGAILEQSRLQGVLQGKASGGLVIDKIMADEEVKAGDKVLTSGGDLIFPKGLLIGTVAKVEKGPEFLQVSVKPAAALNRLEEVLVILKKEEHEPTAPLTPTRASDILAERLPSVPDKAPAPAKNSGVAAAGNGVAAPKPAGVHPAGLSAPNAAQVNMGAGAAQIAKPAASNTATAATVKSGAGVATNGATAVISKPAVATASANRAAPQPVKLPATSKPVADTAQPQPQNPGDIPQ
jgi:rod shape-determining protein MreC